jgi:hypothetical protein
MTALLRAARPRWPLAALLVAAWLAQAPQALAQALHISTATELRAVPAVNGRPLGNLAVGTAAQQLEARGGWVRVKTGDREGWVRLTHVKAQGAATAAPSTAASNPLTGLAGVFSASSNKPTATTGTRGLTQEQLANAQPAPEQVQQMENYAATAAQAQQFARAGKLSAQTIESYKGGE